MRRLGCPTKGGNCVGSPSKLKNWKLSLFVGYYTHSKIESPRPSADHRPHIEKKVALITFRQILSKILPVASIFSYTILTYLKKLDGTKSLNTKQYPAGKIPLNLSTFQCYLEHPASFNACFLILHTPFLFQT